MSFFRTPQGSGIALIVLASLTFVPLLMLLWFRYTFQAVLTFVLRFPVQKSHPNGQVAGHCRHCGKRRGKRAADYA
jgi:hypothetical protein